MNWIDFTILFLLILAFLNGYRRGVFKEISTFIGLILGIIFAVNNADWVVAKLHGRFNFSPTVLFMISYILVLAASIGLLKLLGHFFYKLVKIAPLKVPNKIAGGVFGIAKGVLVLSLLFLLFLFPTPFRSLESTIDSSAMAKPVRAIVPLVYNNTYVLHPRSGEFMAEVHKGIFLSDAADNGANTDDPLNNGTQLGMTNDDVQTLDKLNQYFGKAKKQVQ